jgi:hypothetical protein
MATPMDQEFAGDVAGTLMDVVTTELRDMATLATNAELVEGLEAFSADLNANAAATGDPMLAIAASMVFEAARRLRTV